LVSTEGYGHVEGHGHITAGGVALVPDVDAVSDGDSGEGPMLRAKRDGNPPAMEPIGSRCARLP